MQERGNDMKRYCMGVILLAVAVLTIAGCTGRKQQEQKEPLYKDDFQEDNEGYITVGFSQVGSESDWRVANTQSIKSVFTSDNGYYLLYEDAQNKQENQLKAVRSFILQEVDYIVLDPVVETGWDSVLKEAKNAGIPVIVTDRKVVVDDDELYTCWVGSNFEEEGRKAGRWLENHLEVTGRANDEIRMVTLQGTLESSAQLGRTEGFSQILNSHKNWDMLEYQSADFTQTKAQEVMEYFLNTYQDIDVVVCENDNMAFGAIDAIHEAGKSCGRDGDIIIISFDAVKAALEAMMQGKINVDIECNPQQGELLDEIIRRLEAGETVDKIQYMDEAYFDASMDLSKIVEARTY